MSLTSKIREYVKGIGSGVFNAAKNYTDQQIQGMPSFSVTVDSALSPSSTNPVQNKVIKQALDGKANSTDLPNITGLQPKILEIPIRIDGASATTVEDALAALNNKSTGSGEGSGSSGEGGHIIVDADDNLLDQRTNLKFGADFDITDNQEDDTTEVEEHLITNEEWDSIMNLVPVPDSVKLGTLGFTPCGTVISYFGETAPDNYLICDGSQYNKTDYPQLWTLLSSLTDTTPYVVDEDNTKFKVPDLRGEFLRGTETNSHTNQGSGANVGIHQDGTEIRDGWMNPNKTLMLRYTETEYNSLSDPSYPGLNFDKQDRVINTGTNPSYIYNISGSFSTENYLGAENLSYKDTIRPTNTSVLYCIAYKDIYIDARFDYSTEERVVGTWIDGKPLYQKVIVYESDASTAQTTINHNIGNIDLIWTTAFYQRSTDGTMRTVPTGYIGNDNVVYYQEQTWFVVNDTQIFLRRSSDFREQGKFYFIIKYTKTTD